MKKHIHSAKPHDLRKGKSWMCRCGAINSWFVTDSIGRDTNQEQLICKMIHVEHNAEVARINAARQREDMLCRGIKPESVKRPPKMVTRELIINGVARMIKVPASRVKNASKTVRTSRKKMKAAYAEFIESMKADGFDFY